MRLRVVLSLFALLLCGVAADAGPIRNLFSNRRAESCPSCPQQAAPSQILPADPDCPNGKCPLRAPKTPDVMPAPSAPGSGVIVGGLSFHTLRGRIHAELERRAALPASDPHHINAGTHDKAKLFVGKLGDGHLLDLLIKYGPALMKIVEAILAMLGLVGADVPPDVLFWLLLM